MKISTYIYIVCLSLLTMANLNHMREMLLLLSQIPRDSLKHFDIRTSTYLIFRIEEKILTTTFNKVLCNWTLDVRDISKILWKRGEIAP